MSKFRFARCPYCNAEYGFGDPFDYTLSELACDGWKENAIVKCKRCGQRYNIKVKIMYYGSKIDELARNKK